MITKISIITALISLILSILIFYIGIIWARRKFGITPSISNIWYCLQELGKKINKNHLEDYFILWFSLIAILIQPTIFLITLNKWTLPFSIILCLGLLIIVAAPRYRENVNRKYHIAGVILCALSALIIMLGEHWIYGATLIFITILSNLRAIKDKKYIYWTERGIFGIFFISLLNIMIFKFLNIKEIIPYFKF